jgi:hypothetical protein
MFMEEKIKGIIYRHWIINDEGVLCRYTGQTLQKTVKDRADSGHGYKGCTVFYNHINKYNWKNFNTEVLKEGYYTQEQLDNYEKFYIKLDKENPDIFSLNITEGGSCGAIVEETKQKISETLKKKYANGELSTKGEKNGMYRKTPWNKGVPHTEEAKQKMRDNTDHNLEKNSRWNKDYVMLMSYAKNILKLPTQKACAQYFNLDTKHIKETLAKRNLIWSDL